mmetsp:Transcript_2517/g.8981  ORF Transcript_2517/g.8981 Transcript_2517/m.8981 type:complete len:220 (-) Transcript_2517:78-737(-)
MRLRSSRQSNRRTHSAPSATSHGNVAAAHTLATARSSSHPSRCLAWCNAMVARATCNAPRSPSDITTWDAPHSDATHPNKPTPVPSSSTVSWAMTRGSVAAKTRHKKKDDPQRRAPSPSPNAPSRTRTVGHAEEKRTLRTRTCAAPSPHKLAKDVDNADRSFSSAPRDKEARSAASNVEGAPHAIASSSYAVLWEAASASSCAARLALQAADASPGRPT